MSIETNKRKIGWLKRKARGLGIAWNKGMKNSNFQGSNNPNWKGGETTLVCLECKGHFKVKSYRKNTAHFCSQNCSSQFRNQGKRTADKIVRQSARYKAWRTLVFERDGYKCTQCSIKNGLGKTIYFHADHIKPFALFPGLRFEVSNGRTLCVPCHKATGTYGRGAIYRKVNIASA